jgi:hypothetical protein
MNEPGKKIRPVNFLPFVIYNGYCLKISARFGTIEERKRENRHDGCG